MSTDRDIASRLAQITERFAEVLDGWIGTYILDADHNPVEVSTMEWARWIHNSDNKRVALTQTERHEVSTVFLGLDHSFGGDEPLLFETMVFPLTVIDIRTGRHSYMEEEMDRYATWQQAMAGHEAMVQRVIDFETQQRNQA